MRAEVLNIGTEMLLGNVINTNAAYISQGLAALGIDLFRQCVIGDNKDRLKEALNLALHTNDIIITTGGLGPTYDDLTKETVAELLGLDLELHKASLAHIEAFFKKTGHKMTANNIKQAMVPSGARVMANQNGTAPGLIVNHGAKTIILLPGPPLEMCAMFDHQVMSYLASLANKVIVSRNVHIFGKGEAAVEDLLKDFMETSTNPTIAPYDKDGEVLLRITASASTAREAEDLLIPVAKRIIDVVGRKYIYGIDVGSLQNAVVKQLVKHKLKIATAESCTGGLISKLLTEIPGASNVFECGVCTYCDSMKTQLLGVRENTLEIHGAVSRQTAIEMAKGIRNLSGADFGLATTGFAGPATSGSREPVGLVYVAIDGGSCTDVLELHLTNGTQHERDAIRHLAALHALNLALRTVKRLEN